MIGSISKTVTSTLLALQAARGCVSLGNSCTRPEVKPLHATKLQQVLDVFSPDRGGTGQPMQLEAPRQEIDLVQLATHHSGLPRKATRAACTWQEELDAVLPALAAVFVDVLLCRAGYPSRDRELVSSPSAPPSTT